VSLTTGYEVLGLSVRAIGVPFASVWRTPWHRVPRRLYRFLRPAEKNPCPAATIFARVQAPWTGALSGAVPKS